MILPLRHSYYEATARQRVEALFGPAFQELCGPGEGPCSPHLKDFKIPVEFDDGVVVGEVELDGALYCVVAQEGRFMGGAFGEVHSAKIRGLLRRAVAKRAQAVFFLLDSGGVRLQEANAGEIGVAEVIRCLLDARAASVPVIGAVGGVCGCFGGAGIISCCCDALVASEPARIGVSGPEVIETVMGVEEFDSRDRALVWRTCGAKNRRLLGLVAELVEDDMDAFRAALLRQAKLPRPLTLEAVERELASLDRRWRQYNAMPDALDIWRSMGFDIPENIPAMSPAELERTMKNV